MLGFPRKVRPQPTNQKVSAVKQSTTVRGYRILYVVAHILVTGSRTAKWRGTQGKARRNGVKASMVPTEPSQNGPALFLRYWTAFQRQRTQTASHAAETRAERELWPRAAPGPKVLYPHGTRGQGHDQNWTLGRCPKWRVSCAGRRRAEATHCIVPHTAASWSCPITPACQGSCFSLPTFAFETLVQKPGRGLGFKLQPPILFAWRLTNKQLNVSTANLPAGHLALDPHLGLPPGVSTCSPTRELPKPCPLNNGSSIIQAGLIKLVATGD